MVTNHTPNYALNQWERTDKVLMEDFNEDNLKIDTALKGLAGLISGHSSTLTQKGNCQIYTKIYTGTGTCGESSPATHTFSEPPALLLVLDADGGFLILAKDRSTFVYPGYGYNPVRITWSGNSVSWYGADAKSQMNTLNKAYTLVALCSKS